MKDTKEPKKVNRLNEMLTSAAGVEKLEGFNLHTFFSGVLEKRSADEIENFFAAGTARTTPDIRTVSTDYPKPWLFARILVLVGILYFLFKTLFEMSGEINVLPGAFMIGVFAVPLSMLILFAEMNIPRNISVYTVSKAVLFGAVSSFALTFILGDVLANNLSQEILEWLQASAAGLTEEPAKLLCVIPFLYIKRYKYKLNGFLLGAAVGAGFTIFESLGYAFSEMVNTTYRLSEGVGYNFNTSLNVGFLSMFESIHLRGICALFCTHIHWTAIAAFAIWRVKGDQDFRFSMFFDTRFLRLFCVPVLIHMTWNSGWNPDPLFWAINIKMLLCAAVTWFFVFALLNEGLKEIREEKARLVEEDEAAEEEVEEEAEAEEIASAAVEKKTKTPAKPRRSSRKKVEE